MRPICARFCMKLVMKLGPHTSPLQRASHVGSPRLAPLDFVRIGSQIVHVPRLRTRPCQPIATSTNRDRENENWVPNGEERRRIGRACHCATHDETEAANGDGAGDDVDRAVSRALLPPVRPDRRPHMNVSVAAAGNRTRAHALQPTGHGRPRGSTDATA